MNDLPTSVKVGRKIYRIENWEPKSAAAERRCGDAAHEIGRIRVDTSFGPAQAAETLLHEILHAIFYIWSMEDEDNQERTVGAMSNGLATVMRDNPDVFSWIVRNAAID